MAVVELEHITKTYPGMETPAVDDVMLTIDHGEFMVLLGPSGCGKTTTLRMIAGLESISSGTLRIDGEVMNRVPAKDRDIAMVFQSYALYPHMTVGKNLAFGLRRRRTPAPEIKRRVKATAEMLGLSDLLDRKPFALSGGQRQRVALGRAIVRDPKVFLFDEPLSNLDATLRVHTRNELIKQYRRLGTTMIYVTHDQVEAMTMADRIVVLDEGLVEQIGTPLELYDYPDNIFVASFIGSPAMNFISGRIDRDGDGAWMKADDGTRLPLADDVGVDDGHKVTYGIRPEHLDLGPNGKSLAATVNVVEPTGPEIQVFTEIAGQKICVVFSERHSLSPGQAIELSPALDKVHLFDAESGKRI